jgi:signal transduction histidine kinase
MPEGLLEQIFDPFTSGEESNDEPDSKESEDALGIFDSWKILHDHSGSLTVRSRPGEGTCFVALLPVHRS